MAVSGLSGSMLKLYAEASVDSRKDNRTLIDTQDKRAVASAEKQMILKDRANQEHMRKQLFETVKAGAKTAQAVGKVGDTSSKVAENNRVQSELQTAIENNDLEALKQVEIKDGKTLGDSLSDQEIQGLLAAPGENGQAPTIDEQVGRLQAMGNPRRAELREAIASGDMDRIRGARISDDSNVGDTMGDGKIRELLAEPNEDGSAPTVDQQTDRLMSTAQRREVTPETVRDKMLGELDRVAGHVFDNRKADDEKAASEMAKNRGEIKARRGEMYGAKAQAEQEIAKVAQLAADAHQPLVG